MKNFYVKVENNQQANEVIELAVKLGAKRADTTHIFPVEEEWCHWGVNAGTVTSFQNADYFDYMDEPADCYTLQQLRELVAGQAKPTYKVGDVVDDVDVGIFSESDIKDYATLPESVVYMPKVGEECELLFDDQWVPAKLIGFDEENPVVKLWIKNNVFTEVVYRACFQCEFRPTLTERERFIEAAMMIKTTGAFELDEFIGMMYDAGFKAPEVSE